MKKRYPLITLAILGMDTLVKEKIERTMKAKERREILKGKVTLQKYYNNGAMLNFMEKKPNQMRMGAAGIMAAALVIYGYFLGAKEKVTTRLGMSFLIGGGLSNLLDRFTKGHVVDYFSFNVKNEKLRSIVFNLSDLFVFIGASLLLLTKGFEEKRAH